MPKGRHQLRFEFEVTGKPDVANCKGAPVKAQLYINGKLVGKAEVSVINPLVLGLTSRVTVAQLMDHRLHLITSLLLSSQARSTV